MQCQSTVFYCKCVGDMESLKHNLRLLFCILPSCCLPVVCLGILEVLHCVLVESPEALNIIKEGHIKSIITLLDKHGRNHKVALSLSSHTQCSVQYTYMSSSHSPLVFQL